MKSAFFSIFAIGFLILFTSGYPPSTVTDSLYYYLLIPAIVGIYFRLFKKGLLWPRNIATNFFILFVLLTFISFLINFNVNNISTNIRFLFVITFSYLFCLYVPFPVFTKYYIKALTIISFISIIGYIILNFTSINLPFSTFKNVNDIEYYNGIIFFAIKSFGVWHNSGLDRNIGAFWEPGIFATFILIAIILLLWQKKKSSKFSVLILLTALITTQSTFGYLMLLPISIEIVSKILKGNILNLFKIFVFSLFVFLYSNLNAVIDQLVNFNSQLFSKFVTESNSFTERIDSPLTNLKIFENNFIFGAGLGNTDNLFTIITAGSQTSTSTYFLAAFGFLGIAYTLFFCYGILSYKEVNLTSRFIFLLIILTQVNKEPHIYFTFTFILLFYFLINSSNKSLHVYK